jgi:hypothetical protein
MVGVSLVWLIGSIVLTFVAPVARVPFQGASLLVGAIALTPTCIMFYRRIRVSQAANKHSKSNSLQTAMEVRLSRIY